MGPIRYRLTRLLRARTTTVLVDALVVAALGAVVLVLIAGTLRTLSAPQRYASQQGDAYDTSLEQSSGPPRTAEVAGLPAVARVEVMTFVFGGLEGRDGGTVSDALVFAGSPVAAGLRVVEGRTPRGADLGEFVATRAWVDANRAHLGDGYQLRTITQAQADDRGFDVAEPDGPTVDATLVGVLDGPGQLQDPTPLCIFPASLLDAGDVGVAASVGVVSLQPGATVDELRRQLDALPAGDSFGLDVAEWVPAEVRSAVSAQGQGVAAVAGIVGVAVVAVLGQLLARRVRVPPQQRLALSSVGLTPGQLLADPVARAAVPIVLGSGVGALIAYAASGTFPIGFADRVEPHPGVLLDPVAHGLAALLLAGLLLVWVAAALAVGDRHGREVHAPGVTERVATLMRPGPAALGLRFAVVRHPRDPGSVRAPVAGLVIVLLVLVGALTFGASLDRFVAEPNRQGTTFDLGVGQGGDVIPDRARAALVADRDVAAVAAYGTVLASVGSASLDVTGIEPLRGDLRPDVLEGSFPADDDEIALGRLSARALHVEVGDELAVTGSGGVISYRVTALAVITSVEGGDGIGEGAMVTLPGLRRLAPDATLGSAGIRLRPGAPAGTAERLSADAGVLVTDEVDPPPTVRNLEQVRSTPFLVALALGVLAVLSLAQQLSTSTRRRRRDLAVLRALGVERSWVTRVLHWQATALAALAALVAVPLGVAAGRVAYERFIARTGARDDISVPLALISLAMGGLVLLANLTAVLPAGRARRDRPATVFADE